MLYDPAFWFSVSFSILGGAVVGTLFQYARTRRLQDMLADQAQEMRLSEQREEALQAHLEAHARQNRDLEAALDRWRREAETQASTLARREAERENDARRLAELQDELARQRHKVSATEQLLHEKDIQLSELTVTLDQERSATAEKLALLEHNRDALKQEFELLANRIFDQKNDRFTEQTRNNLQGLLTPFREQLTDFRKRVEDVYTSETRDRQALRSEIHSLKDLNRQITEEAASLTRALRGDKKVQGNWGELILEKVLERSGLRKGTEYETQNSYRDEDRQLWRPDVVVHLPDQRNVIVDAKVSLLAYQAYVAAEDDHGRGQALREHIDAVRKHIRELSAKDYSQLKGLNSPDFVLLFMPIEPAFVAAFQHDDGLFGEAFDSKIVVVTPTTLLATLRTIENIWRYERQSQNARRIADRAGLVYDKLRTFLEHMERLGDQLNTVHGTYDKAMTTLTQGKGNLVSQATQFRSLGVRVKKELPRSLLEKTELDPEVDEELDEELAYTEQEDSSGEKVE